MAETQENWIFLEQVEPARFDAFVKGHPTKSHFMQSVAWGAFNRAARGLEPHLVGMTDESGALVAAAMLLRRKPPVFPAYFYAPRGFVLDFSNHALLRAFTEAAGAYCKTRGAMFLKIDPDVELREIDENGAPVADGFSNMETVDFLQSLGFRHRGFNTGFEHRQPRYTFRIDLTADEAAIKKRILGNVMKNVRKGAGYASEISLGGSGDIPDLYRLITETSERDDFYAYSEDFYQKFYDTLAADDMADLYIGRVFPKEIAAQLEQKLAENEKRRQTLKKEGPIKEAEATKQRLLREQAAFRQYAERYGDAAVMSAHLVVRYGAHAWAVHAGSGDDMKETFLNNRVYLHKILAEKEKGVVWLDQFGTVGNPEESPLKTLHAFKRQFGGRYIEFIGEFDLVLKPFWYFLYERALPRYRALRFDIKALVRKLRGKGR